MSAAPPPLTPSRSDLRDFGFMPLEIVRFRGSGLIAESSAEGALAAVMLWCASWHETPAASLVDNDRVLANAAGYGRAVQAWLAVKDEALRGFVKCSDGRLYHPVVARLANEAWKSKVEQRWRTEVGRRKKWNERHPDDLLSIPTFEAFASRYPDECPNDKITMSQGQLGFVATTGDENDRDIASKGESRDRDRDRETPITPLPPEPDQPEVEAAIDRVNDLMSITNRLANAGGVSIVQPRRLTAAMDVVKRWIEDGIEIDNVAIPTIKARLLDMKDSDTVGSLAYFDAAIRKAQALADAKPRPPKPLFEFTGEGEEIAPFRRQLMERIGEAAYVSNVQRVGLRFELNCDTVTAAASTAAALRTFDERHGEDALAVVKASTHATKIAYRKTEE